MSRTVSRSKTAPCMPDDRIMAEISRRASDWAFLRADSAAGFCVRSDCSRYRFCYSPELLADFGNLQPSLRFGKVCDAHNDLVEQNNAHQQQEKNSTGNADHRRFRSGILFMHLAQGVLHSVESASDPLHYSRLPPLCFFTFFSPAFH